MTAIMDGRHGHTANNMSWGFGTDALLAPCSTSSMFCQPTNDGTVAIKHEVAIETIWATGSKGRSGTPEPEYGELSGAQS